MQEAKSFAKKVQELEEQLKHTQIAYAKEKRQIEQNMMQQQVWREMIERERGARFSLLIKQWLEERCFWMRLGTT